MATTTLPGTTSSSPATPPESPSPSTTSAPSATTSSAPSGSSSATSSPLSLSNFGPRRCQNTLLQRRPDLPAVGEVPRRHEHRRHGRGSLQLPGAAQDLGDRVLRSHGNKDKAPPEEAKPKPAAAALKEWDGVRKLTGNKGLTASGFLCCLVARRSIQLTPTNPAMER
ncbi:uncharacterized protein [Arachis hypogaea]|nr:uncharacterized protein DS421_19g669730 [Arachis hypogaea]